MQFTFVRHDPERMSVSRIPHPEVKIPFLRIFDGNFIQRLVDPQMLYVRESL